MSRIMQALLATSVAFATTLGAAQAAPPRAQDAPRSVTVHYGDLDLNRERDVQALYQRLKSAARTVCQPLESADLRQRQQWRECRATALERAVQRSGSEALAALHAGRAPAVTLAASTGR